MPMSIEDYDGPYVGLVRSLGADHNISKIFLALPGEVVTLAPSGIDTGRLLMLDSCHACDKMHFHIRTTGECLKNLLEAQPLEVGPPRQLLATNSDGI